MSVYVNFLSISSPLSVALSFVSLSCSLSVLLKVAQALSPGITVEVEFVKRHSSRGSWDSWSPAVEDPGSATGMWNVTGMRAAPLVHFVILLMNSLA